MRITINNREAVLPADFSMSLDIENRFFHPQSEEWTLDFDLPLRGCPQNIAIFGNIHRKDVRLSTLTYNCEISHTHFSRKGIAVPISVNETAISLQFLSGRSQLNYKSILEQTLIRDVSLPQTLNVSRVACLANARHDIDDGRTELCLPWMNNYSGNIQNKMDLSNTQTDPETGQPYYYFDSSVSQVSCQIYLIELTRRILVTLGYTVDLTAWNSTVWKYLLVWNAVPAAWGEHNFNIALPKWTVMEYLEQIELLTGLDFEIDEEGMSITCQTSRDVVDALSTVVLDNVEEHFEMEIGDNILEFREGCELKYADRGDEEWKYESCTDAVTKMEQEGVLDDSSMSAQDYYDDIYPGYAEEDDLNVIEHSAAMIDQIKRYCKLRIFGASASGTSPSGWTYEIAAKFLNEFGATSADSETTVKEIKIVPAWITYITDSTQMHMRGYSNDYVTLDPGEYDKGNGKEPTTIEEAAVYKDRVERNLDKGEAVAEYYNKLFVTFWKKDMAHVNKIGDQIICLNQNANQVGVRNKLRTMPNGERYMIHYFSSQALWNQIFYNDNMTLCLRSEANASYYLEKIDSRKKYTFRWISKTLPDVKSVFLINGRRYYCEVIKTKWSINGMSEKLEGDFYEIS